LTPLQEGGASLREISHRSNNAVNLWFELKAQEETDFLHGSVARQDGGNPIQLFGHAYLHQSAPKLGSPNRGEAAERRALGDALRLLPEPGRAGRRSSPLGRAA